MRSILLLTAMMFLLVGLVYAGGLYFGLGGPVIAAIAAIVVVFSTFMSWFQSDRLVIAMTRAHEADPVQYAQLHNVVEEIAIAAGLPKPRVYIVDDPAPNAFATGRDPNHGVIAFTTGILGEMNRAELEGVTAHEMAHIRNRDTLVSAVAAATAGALAVISDILLRMMIFGGGRGRRGGNNNAAGAIGLIAVVVGAILAPIAAVLLQAAISRKREALADATSVEFTRNPSGLRSALQKLQQDTTVVKARASSVAHVWIESPLDESNMSKLFSTHPPLSERIDALERLEGMA
jgi:heat shock protein HtpX